MKKEDVSSLLRKQHELEDKLDEMEKYAKKINETILSNDQARKKQTQDNLQEERELMGSRYFNEIFNLNENVLRNYNQVHGILNMHMENVRLQIKEKQREIEEISQQIIEQKKKEDDENGQNETK